MKNLISIIPFILLTGCTKMKTVQETDQSTLSTCSGNHNGTWIQKDFAVYGIIQHGNCTGYADVTTCPDYQLLFTATPRDYIQLNSDCTGRYFSCYQNIKYTPVVNGKTTVTFLNRGASASCPEPGSRTCNVTLTNTNNTINFDCSFWEHPDYDKTTTDPWHIGP